MRYTVSKIRPGYYAINDAENPKQIIMFDSPYGEVAMASKPVAAKAAATMNSAVRA